MVFVIILLSINLLLRYFQNQILWVFFSENCRLFLVVEKMKENLKRIKWNVRRELTFLYDLRLECLLFLLFAREGFGWDFWERKLIHINIHIHTHKHTHTHTYTLIHIHLYTYTYTYTLIHIHIYTYTHTHINTHTHTHTFLVLVLGPKMSRAALGVHFN